MTGIPGLTLTSQNLSVLVNQPDASGTVMNLAADPLQVLSGPGRSVTLDFASSAGPLLEASGTMNVSVESFFTLAGDFAIRRSSDTLQDSTGANVDVDLLTLGAENLTAFAGLNGGTSDAIGLSLADAGFALAVATSKTNPELTWKALVADAGSA
ncbi:MAG: hypothetical protein ACKPJD_38560, partial [Planctomycetaceae bacterium]